MLHARGLETAEFICSKEEWKESRAARNDTQLGGSKSRELKTIHTTITLKVLSVTSRRQYLFAGLYATSESPSQEDYENSFIVLQLETLNLVLYSLKLDRVSFRDTFLSRRLGSA